MSRHPRRAIAQDTVTGETTLAAARRLAGTGHDQVACLNFASAKNPGCGVFRNDPAEVATVFAALLHGEGTYGTFAGRFDHIVFAVWDPAPGAPRYAAFRRVLDQPVT